MDKTTEANFCFMDRLGDGYFGILKVSIQGKMEEHNSDDLYDLIEENKNETTHCRRTRSGARNGDDLEKKKDIVHEKDTNTHDEEKEQIMNIDHNVDEINYTQMK
ncbi:unnamed protein product, partial [Linum tenue]